MKAGASRTNVPDSGAVMRGLAGFVRVADAVNEAIGSVAAWLVLGIVGVCFAVATLRYGFSYGRVWMQDLYVWLHAIVFTAAAGWALKRGAHVRVDIFYQAAGPRFRAWVDLLGTLFLLLPYLTVLAIWSRTYVTQSWAIGEGARNADGMPALYILKSFLLVYCAVLALQGLALAARSVLVLAGHDHLLPASAEVGEGSR